MRLLVLTALAAAALCGCGGATANGPRSDEPMAQAHASSSQVPGASPTPRPVGLPRVVTCTGTALRPRSIGIACGDGNALVAGLTWSTWAPTSAIGRGTWWQNDCRPYCAAGHFKRYPVELRFSQPTLVRGHMIFGRLVAVFTARSPVAAAASGGREIVYDHGRYCRGCPPLWDQSNN